MMTCTSKSSIPCQSTPFHLPAYQCELLAILLLLMCRGKHCLLPLCCLKCELCHFRQVILQSYLLSSPVDNRITNRYNGGGRIVSDVWTYFSNADNPQKKKTTKSSRPMPINLWSQQIIIFSIIVMIMIAI